MARRGGGVDVAVAAAAAAVIVVVVVDQTGMTQSMTPTPTPATTRCKDSAVSIAFLRACVKLCNKCKELNITNTGLHTF